MNVIQKIADLGMAVLLVILILAALAAMYTTRPAHAVPPASVERLSYREGVSYCAPGEPLTWAGYQAWLAAPLHSGTAAAY